MESDYGPTDFCLWFTPVYIRPLNRGGLSQMLANDLIISNSYLYTL